MVVIGLDLFKRVERMMDNHKNLKSDKIEQGMFGNMRTRTYIFEVEDETLMLVRKQLMEDISKLGNDIIAMYVYDDWKKIIVMPTL